MGQQSAQKSQEAEYQQWAAMQSRNRALENQRQEAMREQATGSAQQAISELEAENAKKNIGDEQTRLAQYLEGKDASGGDLPSTTSAPISQADRALSGQNQSDDPLFKSTLAQKLSDATKDSKNRIAALAKVQSYGGSSGGFQQNAKAALGEAGRGIDLVNNARRGSLGAYQTEQAVNPRQMSYTPSPFASLASTALSIGAQGLGNQYGGGLGSMFSKAAVPVTPRPEMFGPPKPLYGPPSPFGVVGVTQLF
jgi:hypothetical protein